MRRYEACICLLIFYLVAQTALLFCLVVSFPATSLPSENDAGPRRSLLSLSEDSPDDLFTCKDLEKLDDVQYIASGWNKAVYSGRIDGKPVAVKTVDLTGKTMTSCQEAGSSEQECYKRVGRTVIREIENLNSLQHPNVIQLLGHCLPQELDLEAELVSIVTQLGKPVSLLHILQLPWEEKLQICVHLADLLAYLSEWNVGINDFQQKQFVLVDRVLKLVDLDDLSIGEPKCQADSDCLVTFPSGHHVNLSCLNNVCPRYHEVRNLYHAGRQFINFLLPHGLPSGLQEHADFIVSNLTNLSLTARQLADQLNALQHRFINGLYLPQLNGSQLMKEYEMVEEHDLPQLHDYPCKFSLMNGACVMSVYNSVEAMDICSRLPDCRSFVFTPQQTPTGRYIVHFKNGTGKSVAMAGRTLYLRRL